MPGTGYDAAAEAARRAAEEAEKAKRRKAIQEKIDKWNEKKVTVISQKNELAAEKQNLETQLSNWERQKIKYNGNSLLCDVVIVDVFEGVSAEKVKACFEEGVGEMDQTCANVERLKQSVVEQIQKLDQYVSDINENIRILIQEKNAI